MAIAKVILNGVTQMDVTDKSVTAGSMLSGTTALKNDGTDITGNIESKTSADLTASGATVTAPAGYYASAASKSVASGSAKTPATTITANPTVSVNSSGLITATVSKTQNVTPTVSAGYVSSGTAGTITVSGSGTNQLTTQGAQTIHPSTTDQTIASGKYLTGAQTVKAVTTTNLTAANIVQGVTVKVGDSTDDDCVVSVTGTAETGGNDFIITLTKNASTGIWEPDCTFADAKAAYDAGKNVAFVATEEVDGYITSYPCMSNYVNDQNPLIYYGVDIPYNNFVSTYTTTQYTYYWDSTGVSSGDNNPVFYNADNATAVPADVASGKVFYNADGYQVGTASSGGGLVTGTRTVETTIQMSADFKITDTTAIGFTPTKFLFLKDTDTKMNATIYSSTYTEQAGVATRTKSTYVEHGGYMTVLGVGSSWTTRTDGYLYLSAGKIYIYVSSANRLEAGTYTWYAIQ